ncbi:hypothetical protein C8Q78DRAFT_795351 [Trametes maxima]|nr:hypothetical protein C8Q78DRAFT_795351 [Trametes maxima]
MEIMVPPDILQGPVASWSQHYTSNRVGKKEAGGLYDQDAGMTASTPAHWQGRATRSISAESEIFRPLGAIVNAIADVPLPNISPSCRYHWGEALHTQSEVSEARHNIDGGLRLVETSSPSDHKKARNWQTLDIAVNFAFQCEDTPDTPDTVSDNRWRTLYSAYHTLRGDCRRKHTYSITIEDDRVALWYFSRSHSAKSTDFNFFDVRAVVEALASLIFSTVEDLGYDTDVRRVVEKDARTEEVRIHYVYRVEGRFFKTVKCRDDHDDLRISGRATRVWEVVEAPSFDETRALSDARRTMVLRDVWLEDGSETEREIQTKIFQRCDELAKAFPADDDPRLHEVDEETRELLRRRLLDGSYKDLFLTISADSRGATSKSCAEGFTAAPELFADLVDINREATRPGSDTKRTPSPHALSTPDVSIPRAQRADDFRDYRPRQRNFVVYEEVCSALHELDDLHVAVQALLDALLALQILFLISWIHRDRNSTCPWAGALQVRIPNRELPFSWRLNFSLEGPFTSYPALARD